MSSFMRFSICATYCTLSREECEEKLKTLIVEMKAEIAEAQRLKDVGEGNGRPPEEKKGKWGKEQK